MSLIVAFNVRDGLVVAADRCTTHHENNTTSHSFDSRKIVILDETLAVLHCGDYFVSNNISAHEFLEDCVDLIVPDMDITALPLALLSKYKREGYQSHNTFFVCGFDKSKNGFIYSIDTDKNSVEQVYGNRKYGGTWSGITNVATPILRQAACDRVSLMDTAILCKLAIEATGKSQFHCGIALTVGDKADVYVMHKDGKTMWFSGDAGFLLKGEPEHA